MFDGRVAGSEIDPLRGEPAGFPDDDIATTDHRSDSLAGGAIERLGVREIDVPGVGAIEYGAGEGVFGERFGARRGSQDLVFAAVAERDDGIDCRFALRNGAGLIENDRLDIREDLEGVAIPSAQGYPSTSTASAAYAPV